MNGRLAPILTIFFVLVGTARARAAEPDAAYTFTLSVDPKTGIVTGDGQIAFTNSSSQPIDRLPLLLYANRFATRDPRINDVNFSRYYSYRFHAGEIKLERIVGPGGVPCDVAPLEGMPQSTYVAVKLPAPVGPNETVTIGLRFETRVPDRFGLFGRRGERLIAEGGLWPLVPARDASGAFVPASGPMRAKHDITITATSGAAFVAPAREARTVLVAAGEDLEPSVVLEARPGLLAPRVTVRGPQGDDRLRRLGLLVQGAAQSFSKDWLKGPGTLEPITVVLAPVRDRLAHAAGDVVVVSDRIFEVLPYLDSFHEREVTRAAFELLARRAVLSLEEADAAWVSEVVGWVAIEEWDRARLGLKGTELRQGLGTFDFIQFIDSQLRAPQFSDSDLYFGQVWEPRNTVRDDLDRFGSSRPRGRVVAEKLRDRIGSERLKKLVLVGGLPLRARAAQLAQEDLGPFFDLWLGAPPIENLLIESRETVTLPDGSEGIAVTVRRETDDPRLGAVGEPVTIEASSGGVAERRLWDGKGDRTTITFPRRGLFYSVDVDPDGRIEQGYRGDDIYPSIAKVLLNRFAFSIDLNGGNTSSVDAGFTIRPGYDYQHSILVDGFYQQTSQGGRLGYAYHFGTSLTEIQFGQSVSAGINVEHLDRGLLRFAGDTLTESRGNLVAYSIGYGISTREAWFRGTHGLSLGVGLEASHGEWLGGDFSYQKGTVGAVYLFTPFQPITLAFQAGGGQVVGEKPATQVLFDVGGEGGVRGVRTGDFVNRASFIAKGEVRVSVLEDLDIGIVKLAWVRRIEVAGFTDGGDVQQSMRRVFHSPSQWKWGAGAGLRVEIDAFGVRPILLRFDIAWRCDSGEGPGRGVPQYYIGANQSF